MKSRGKIHGQPIIRSATYADLPRLTEIYNYYTASTPITFDVDRYTVETRTPWFEEHSDRGRHRLLVAEENDIVIGYATSGPFSRPKAVYNLSVDSSIYRAPEATRRGIGSKSHAALFEVFARQRHQPCSGRSDDSE